MPDLKYLRHKSAKGRDYWYFDTGQVDERGRRILTPLPPKRSLEFGGSYARALAARTSRLQRRAYLSFDELIRRYEKSPEFRKLAENSKKTYSRYLAVANELLRTSAGQSPPAAAIEPRDVLRVRDKLASTPGAANATIRAVAAMYAWAINPAIGYAKDNPARPVQQFDAEGEHEPWPAELLELALADPRIRLPVALLYFLGQRIGDTVKMSRRALSGDSIDVVQQKTGTPLQIQLHRQLAAILDADAPRDAVMFLVNEQGKPLTEGAVRQRIQAWARSHGHHVVPHGLRKNAVNALLEAGCSTAEVSAITGQDLKTIEHYAKRRNQVLLGRSAIAKLEDARAWRKNGTGK
jgi:integrase